MKLTTAISGIMIVLSTFPAFTQNTFSVHWEDENIAQSLHGFIFEQDTIRILQRSSRSNLEILNSIDFDADGEIIKHDTILENPLWDPLGYRYKELTDKAFRRFNQFDPIVFWTGIFIDDASQITTIPRFGILDRESLEFRMSRTYFNFDNNSLEDLLPWNDTLLLLLIKAEQNDHTRINLSMYNSATMFLERSPVYIAKEQKSLVPSQFIVTSDQEVMITGFSRTPDYESIFVMKLNDQLEEIWYKEFLSVSHYGSIKPSMLVDKNGDIIVAAGRIEPGKSHIGQYLMRLSGEDGNLLDERILNGPGNAAFTDNLIMTGDDYFISTGFVEKHDPLSDTILQYATLTKFNMQFDVEWERRFEPVPGKSCKLGYLEQSRDGGLVASGKIYYNGSIGSSFPWLVRMDSEGCIAAGCDSLALISHTMNYLLDKIDLEIFPNPAGSEIKATIKQTESGKYWNASVYNLQGQRLLNAEIFTSDSADTLNLDISVLKPGLYILELANLTGAKSLARFIKSE